MKMCKVCDKRIKSDEPYIDAKLGILYSKVETLCVPCFKKLYPEDFETCGYCPTEEVS